MRREISIALLLIGTLAVAPGLRSQAPTSSDAPSQNQPPVVTPQPSASANPFPEDTSAVPVMPTKESLDQPNVSHDGAESSALPLPGEDLDPVRSPDDPEPIAAGAESEVESSSSLKGLEKLLPAPGDDQPDRKRKPAVKQLSQQEVSAKDIEIGLYYIQTKNWKAARSRFESAMVLDPENPNVYWGMAEAERHTGDLAAAKVHYQKLLDYDPDGPHGKEARKALKDPAIANAQSPTPPK
jgi:tetratricopeptide (TPR) repeat protein